MSNPRGLHGCASPLVEQEKRSACDGVGGVAMASACWEPGLRDAGLGRGVFERCLRFMAFMAFMAQPSRRLPEQARRPPPNPPPSPSLTMPEGLVALVQGPGCVPVRVLILVVVVAVACSRTEGGRRSTPT
ncbi:hypothetical protein PMIN06_001026 [Paraphaeosphaeria minitans]